MQTASTKQLLKLAPQDKSSPEFQSFVYQFFTNKRRFKTPAYANLVGEGNRCNPEPRLNKRGKPIKEYPKLSLHQAVVNNVMKVLAYNPQNTNRGLLAWHSTGSGKTLTATAVMDAFWDTDRHIIYVSSVEGKNSNPPENFYGLARKFLKRFKQKKYTGGDQEATTHLVGEAFKARKVQFMTFAQLAHFLLIANPLKSVTDEERIKEHKYWLDNAVVIIDEVHNIFKPLPNQKKECDALRKFLMDPKNPKTKNTKMVVLTATPGDSPNDIIDLLNMVRDQKKPVVTVPNVNNEASMKRFRDQVRGLVSFFDMSGDLTKFPAVFQEDETISNMSLRQFETYAEAFNKTMDDNKQNNFEVLEKANKTKKYLEYARKYSNMLYKVQDGDEIQNYSSKLAALLERVKQYPDEKHYVYSSFFTKHGFGGQGIVAIANTLRDMGYAELRPRDATQALIADASGLENMPRFVLATTPALTRDTKNAGRNLKKLVQVFNSPHNARGEKVQIFLASQGYNEGVDLRGVRHIHIFDPLVTVASEKQAIGRAARHCSHSDLSLKGNEWTVKVHRYYAEKPLNLVVKDPDAVESEINDNEKKRQSFEAQLELYKGSRKPEAKEARDNIKQTIAEIKDKNKALKVELKKVVKFNYKNVKMVDRQVREEALERMKVLSATYQAIYDTAVDCHLFKEFHKMAGYDIKCEPMMQLMLKRASQKGLKIKKVKQNKTLKIKRSNKSNVKSLFLNDSPPQAANVQPLQPPQTPQPPQPPQPQPPQASRPNTYQNTPRENNVQSHVNAIQNTLQQSRQSQQTQAPKNNVQSPPPQVRRENVKLQNTPRGNNVQSLQQTQQARGNNVQQQQTQQTQQPQQQARRDA